jgi:hypothetical protein
MLQFSSMPPHEPDHACPSGSVSQFITLFMNEKQGIVNGIALYRLSMQNQKTISGRKAHEGVKWKRPEGV